MQVGSLGQGGGRGDDVVKRFLLAGNQVSEGAARFRCVVMGSLAVWQ